MSVRVSTLSNGVRVATDPMSGVESLSIGAWIDAGARHEPVEINGAAHMLEHMVFKGTRRRSALAIAEEIENVGGSLNAYTAREQTAFYARVLRDDAGLALDMIADMLRESVFDPDELERERAVILQEIAQSNDTPDDIIFDRFQQTAFPDQSLGRPVLGPAETVAAMPRDRLIGYMRAHYTGPRTVVAAAGAIDHDWLVRETERLFGDVSAEEPEAPETGSYVGGGHREERDIEQTHIVVGFRGIGATDKRHYVQSVMSTLVGGGMSSRLFQEIRERRGLAYSVYSFGSGFMDTGVFGVYAGAAPDQIETVAPVIAEELTKAARHIGQDELDRAKAQCRAGVLMAQESSAARCEQLASQLLTLDRPVPTEESIAEINAATVEDCRALLTEILSSPPTIALIGPGDGLPSCDAIDAAVRAWAPNSQAA